MEEIEIDVGTVAKPMKYTIVAMPSLRTEEDNPSCNHCIGNDPTNHVKCNDLPPCGDIVWVDKDELHLYVAERLGDKE